VSFKTKVLAGTGALAMALAGTVMATATTATAGGPTIIPGPGTSITCSGLKAKAALTPALKQNWLKSEHASDPDPAWVAAPDTEFATESPTTTTTATGKANCTGTVTDGTNTATVSKVTFSANSVSTNTAEVSGPFAGKTFASCGGLATQSGTNFFDETVTFISKTAVIPPVTVHASLSTLIDTHGVGFDLTSVSATGTTGTVGGDTKAYIDAKSVIAVASSAPTSTVQPKNVCEPSAKVKKGVLALKAPKGLGQIKITTGAFDGSPSVLVFSLS
jgi:hypothetical protein